MYRKTIEVHDGSFEATLIIASIVVVFFILSAINYNATEYQPTPAGKESDRKDRARLTEWNSFAKVHKLQPITIDQAILLNDRDVARMELAVLARENEASIVNATDYVTHPAGKGSVTKDE